MTENFPVTADVKVNADLTEASTELAGDARSGLGMLMKHVLVRV